MKLYKLLFSLTMIMGTVIAISSYSWIGMWMGLEINLLSIIPLMSSDKNMYSSESSLKYFVTQAMASMILVMSVLMMMLESEFINPLVNLTFNMTLNSALLIKLGAAPFHFWFPEVIEGLNWSNSLIILTWQKIAPMMILMQTNIQKIFLVSIILSCLITSTINGFNQTSMRKILAFSSINHIAWMLSTLLTTFSLWLIYFSVYSLLNMNIISLMKSTKSFYLNQIMLSMNKNMLIKMSFMMNFLSLGGIPPLIGFMPKWLIINWLTDNSFLLLNLTMILFTLIMLFIYIRVMISTLTMSLMEYKMNTNFSKPLTTLNMISLLMLPMCTIMFNFL